MGGIWSTFRRSALNIVVYFCRYNGATGFPCGMRHRISHACANILSASWNVPRTRADMQIHSYTWLLSRSGATTLKQIHEGCDIASHNSIQRQRQLRACRRARNISYLQLLHYDKILNIHPVKPVFATSCG